MLARRLVWHSADCVQWAGPGSGLLIGQRKQKGGTWILLLRLLYGAWHSTFERITADHCLLTASDKANWKSTGRASTTAKQWQRIKKLPAYNCVGSRLLFCFDIWKVKVSLEPWTTLNCNLQFLGPLSTLSHFSFQIWYKWKSIHNLSRNEPCHAVAACVVISCSVCNIQQTFSPFRWWSPNLEIFLLLLPAHFNFPTVFLSVW